MRLPQLIAGFACVLLLGACSMPTMPFKASKPTLNLAEVLAESDKAAAASQNDKAASLLKSAAAAYPQDKEPWLRLARINFANNQNGDALSNALEVLQRDPGDRQAHAIVAVCGMRLASRSMGELGNKNNWNEERLIEAQQLSRQVQFSLAAPEPAPVAVTAAPLAAARPVRPAAAPLPDSPLGILKACKTEGACNGQKK